MNNILSDRIPVFISSLYSSYTMIIIITMLCGLFGMMYYHLQRRPLYRKAAQFPGPKAFPLVGNALMFVGDSKDILPKMLKLCNTYPSPLRFWFAHRLYVAVFDPENTQTVLHSSQAMEKDVSYYIYMTWVGTGLFTAPAEKWRVHRKLIGPTFSMKILESYVEIFAKQSQILVEQLQQELHGNEFELPHYINLCTLDMILDTAMGLDLKMQTGKNLEFHHATQRMKRILWNRICKLWLRPDIIFYNTREGKELRQVSKYLNDFTMNVISKKKKALDTINGGATNGEVYAERQQKRFLDRLIELTHDGTKFTAEELRDEVQTMIAAGHDSVGQEISFALLMLASHPEVQDKVYEELYEIFGSSDIVTKPVKHEDLRRMEFLERVIKETLRLFPIGTLFPRQVTDDLNLGSYTIPKGSSVMLMPIVLHRMEKYWPDALKFDPDRFLPENVEKRHPCTFIPFSAGPRNCIGPKYAMMVMKTVIATLIRTYVIKKNIITPIKDIKLRSDIVLSTVEPITLSIEKRSLEA